MAIVAIATAVVCARAGTEILTLPMLVREADVIVVATATSEPKRAGLLYLANISRGEREWIEPETSHEEITNALQQLIRMSCELASNSPYDGHLVNREIARHQRRWATEFRVSEPLKGLGYTNVVVTCMQPYRHDKPEKFPEGRQYILFLRYQHDGHLGLDDMQRALPVASEYEWYDRWKTTAIGTKRNPIELRDDEHDGMRRFTHNQFLQRIRALVKEQREEAGR